MHRIVLSTLNCFNCKATKIKCTYFSDLLNSSMLILNIYFLLKFLLKLPIIYIYIFHIEWNKRSLYSYIFQILLLFENKFDGFRYK